MATSLVVQLKIRRGWRDKFVSIARAHGVNSIELEPGCMSYQVMMPAEDPDSVILVEVYEDDAALKSHLESPHMNHYLEEVAKMVEERVRYRCTL